jgi:hypothetical protein
MQLGSRMSLISPPEPPERIVLDLQKVGRRWQGVDALTVEAELERAGVELVSVPQKPKKGVRLSDLLAFEEQWRQAELEREKQREADYRRHLEANKRLRLRKQEADALDAETERRTVDKH